MARANKTSVPVILDGIKLRRKDRVLVTGQPVKKFNGIFHAAEYSVVTPVRRKKLKPRMLP